MAELESTIISVADTQYNLASLAECVTVGDVERLFDKQGTEQNSPEKAIDDFGSNMTPNSGPSVISMIADTCGADPESLIPDAYHEALVIDSLMFSKLHSRLHACQRVIHSPLQCYPSFIL